MSIEHAKLSPSSASRWLQCPGSVQLSEQAGSGDFESVYAREGTLAHKVAEIEAGNAFGLITKAQYEERMLHWRDITPVEQHDDMLRHAAEYVELLRGFMAEHEGSQLLLEQRVDPGIPASWGTADAVVISPTNVHVIDYKYGRGIPVYAENNPQLRIYGVGALEQFDLTGQAETVCMTVHQPRLDSVSHACMDAAELRLWRDVVVLPQAKLALSGEGYLSPSETACRFCPVSGQCAARSQYMTKRDFGNPDLLGPEQLAEILTVLPDIEDWAKRVRETALRRAYHDGVEIPGWKVIQSNGRRAIRDHDRAIAKLVEAGYDMEEISRVSTRTLGDLERLAGGRKELDRLLGSLVVRSEGVESLVPESDTRPAVNSISAAHKDFSAISAE